MGGPWEVSKEPGPGETLAKKAIRLHRVDPTEVALCTVAFALH